jgi:hypothetical protein
MNEANLPKAGTKPRKESVNMERPISGNSSLINSIWSDEKPEISSPDITNEQVNTKSIRKLSSIEPNIQRRLSVAKDTELQKRVSLVANSDPKLSLTDTDNQRRLSVSANKLEKLQVDESVTTDIDKNINSKINSYRAFQKESISKRRNSSQIGNLEYDIQTPLKVDLSVNEENSIPLTTKELSLTNELSMPIENTMNIEDESLSNQIIPQNDISNTMVQETEHSNSASSVIIFFFLFFFFFLLSSFPFSKT